MRIFLCDDEINELNILKKYVFEYAENNLNNPVDIKCFDKSFDVIDELNKSGAPDIALLDICMPEILGTKIALEIKKNNQDTDIIFLTTSNEYAVEAFSLHASDYIKKPYTKEKLYDTLNRVVDKKQKRYYVPLQSGKETVRIDLYTILYAETGSNGIEIHLKSGKKLKLNMTLSKLMNLVNDIKGFSFVGASYIVNFRYIHTFLENTIELVNNEHIPVPRRLKNDIKNQYFDFYKQEAIK